MDDVGSQLKALVAESGFELTEQIDLAGRPGAYAPVPTGLGPTLRRELEGRLPKGMYTHQARGIDLALAGHDLCLATPTASGKSLVFMSVVADSLLRDPTARALALYPAKALIQDQLGKWKALLSRVGLSPGYIDGAVRVEQRARILRAARLVLMTPDVAHAWLMSHLQEREVAQFVAGLRVLVLDEAHVYEGVFGTNMSYFLRRLLAVTSVRTVISSTATVGEPADFIERLCGRRPDVLTYDDSGSPAPPKSIILARPEAGRKAFDAFVQLLVRLAQGDLGRFLAFGDSRKMVEQLVAIAQRAASQAGNAVTSAEEDTAEGEPPESDASGLKILPYRAGYEEEDRKAIQEALVAGQLAGVVSTSALELGLDIGEIDLVLMLTTPPSVKAFWQRLGRAGRKKAGYCLLVDDKGVLSATHGGLKRYLAKAPEPAWLYLDNVYVQYAHALCAAAELAEVGDGRYDRNAFQSVPDGFLHLLENEISPTEGIPDELYPLKQRAQAGPHYEFPLRSSIEKSFEVKELGAPGEPRLGTLSYSQALRETYPGAIYYYMARPYRVANFYYRRGEVKVRRERRWTTQPVMQSSVFPKLPGGLLFLARSETAFLVETALQVNERVVGFTEQRGPNKISNAYGPGSPYSQRPITRFFETTGVCWYFPDAAVLTEAVGGILMEAFSEVCGVQERDLGIGRFQSRGNSFWESDCRGLCIYDGVYGSLRLTSQLASRFDEVIDAAQDMARSWDERDYALEAALESLRRLAGETVPEAAPSQMGPPLSGDWVVVVASGQMAMYVDDGGSQEVKVLDYRYTPQGLMYQLESPRAGVVWMVRAATIVPINGVTELLEVNLTTGESRPVA